MAEQPSEPKERERQADPAGVVERLRALFDEVYERGHWDWPTHDASRADKRRLAVDEAMAKLSADAEASAMALRAAQEKES